MPGFIVAFYSMVSVWYGTQKLFGVYSTYNLIQAKSQKQGDITITKQENITIITARISIHQIGH